MRRRIIGGVFAGGAGARWRLSAALTAAEGTVADAAMKGDVAAVRTLLKDGADVNAVQGDGVTGLHWAARQGAEELASTLIVAGANVRATTRFGAITPLHLAAERGSRPGGHAARQGRRRRRRPHQHRRDAADVRGRLGRHRGRRRRCSRPAPRSRPRSASASRRRSIFAAAANRAEVVKLLLGARRQQERDDQGRST